MKTKALRLILALVFIGSFAIAATLTFTQSPEYLWRYQADVTLDGSGNPLTAAVTAFFEQDLVPSSSASATITNHTGQVSFDLVAKGTTTVTASGVQVTYLQLAWLNAAAAHQEYLAQQAAAAAAAAAAVTVTTSGP